MIIEKSETRVEVIYSDNKAHRFLIKRVWDASKNSVCIIMLSPSRTADAIALDMTGMYIINNCHKQGFGSVSIMNIYSGLDESLESTAENDEMLVKVFKESDTIVLAWGKGNQTKPVLARIDEVCKLLKPFQKKLMEISDGNDSGYHPLGRTVRLRWKLVPVKTSSPKQEK